MMLAGLLCLSACALVPQDNRTSVDPDVLLAENDRAIAENRRMIEALQAYARADPDKLTRLRTACQRKLGEPADRNGAMRIFNCIRGAW